MHYKEIFKPIVVALTILGLAIMLASCAALDEMAETGEPPVRLANQYTAAKKMATGAKLINSPWNYVMGILYSVTNGGIDLLIEMPNES